MRQFALGEVSAFLGKAHPGLRKTQFDNLCLVVHALIVCGRPCLSAVARCLSGPARLIHRIKRVYRFITNPRLPREQLAAQLAYVNWAYAAGRRPLVVIDHTELGNGLVSLWTALVYRGRSVPLLCRVLPRTMTEGSRNTVENTMILQLQALFGTGWVLIADRGFARASLLELLHVQGIEYVIRIDDHTTIHTKEGRQLVNQLPLGRKRRLWLGPVYYHSQRKVPTHLLICQKQKRRWNLASSLQDPNAIHEAYRCRMQIEEMFRDLKQRLCIARLPCHTLERYAARLLLVAIAYSYLYWLGQLAQPAGLSNSRRPKAISWYVWNSSPTLTMLSVASPSAYCPSFAKVGKGQTKPNLTPRVGFGRLTCLRAKFGPRVGAELYCQKGRKKSLRRSKPALRKPEQRLRVNRMIRANEVRVVTAEGQQLGIMPLADALREAEERGLDLIEVAPNADPPVCRIMDYGKFRYQQRKKERDSLRKSRQIEVKTIRVRPNTDEHDLQVKGRHAIKFLEKGHKVKFTVIFRGPELRHREIGRDQLLRFVETCKHLADIEQPPRMEARMMTMVLAPKPEVLEHLHTAKRAAVESSDQHGKGQNTQSSGETVQDHGHGESPVQEGGA